MAAIGCSRLSSRLDRLVGALPEKERPNSAQRAAIGNAVVGLHGDELDHRTEAPTRPIAYAFYRASRCSVNNRRLDSKADKARTASNVEAPAIRRPAIRLFCSATIFCAPHTRRWARARGSSSGMMLEVSMEAWPSQLGSARGNSRLRILIMVRPSRRR
jgi:hypothetical protein